MELGQLSEQTKKHIEDIYFNLNPAQLKRQIEAKTQEIYRAYERKKGGQKTSPFKKQLPLRLEII
jgi:hypothetical protein